MQPQVYPDNSVLSIASDYVAAGVSVCPLRLDGSKAAAVSWKPYQERLPTVRELQRWFSRPAGIAMICGTVSNGLEVLDFDHDADDTFNVWVRLIPKAVYAWLCVIETPSGGYHVLYRCNEICGNTKIAMTADDPAKVLVESRGGGGYIAAVGSPSEVHTSGRPYVQTWGRPLPELPVFSVEQRVAMWQAAASLDQRPDPLKEYVDRRVRQLREQQRSNRDQPQGSTPWDAFNARATWSDILSPAGWRTADGIHWTRPGKRFGKSASIRTTADDAEVLVVFSSNAGPLSPSNTSGHRTWDKFGAYAALNHIDRSAAARELQRKGYR